MKSRNRQINRLEAQVLGLWLQGLQEAEYRAFWDEVFVLMGEWGATEALEGSLWEMPQEEALGLLELLTEDQSRLEQAIREVWERALRAQGKEQTHE